MADVTLRGVARRFGGRTALDGVDLDISDGEFFCVLGPPSSGKSTLLRTIVGLEPPDEGTVSIGGRDVTDLAPAARDIAIVFQNLALYPDKTVYDNLAFPLRQRKDRPGRDEERRRVEQAARTLGIEKLLSRRPAQLSGGERQRVAIGRALVRTPRVFLFDEPLSALDALLRIRMRAELKHLQRELGRTLVYVTNDQVEAMSMADRVCVLESGRVLQVAPPRVVYDRPASTYVSRIVGTPPMNLLPLEIRVVDGELRLQAPGFSLAGPPGPALEGVVNAQGQRLVLGARPEDISIVPPARSLPTARVVAVEPLGGEVVVDVEFDGRIVKAIEPPGTVVAPDDLVGLQIDLSRVHVFVEDGEALYHAAGRSDLTLVEDVGVGSPR